MRGFLYSLRLAAIAPFLLYPAAQAAIPSNYPLRIIPIGDSITVGIGDEGVNSSTDAVPDGKHNGYRLDLYNLLTNDGLAPKFFGAQVSGAGSPQPDMEGYGGNWINQIQSHLEQDDPWPNNPNLLLIHAGTNDIAFGNEGGDPTTNRANAPYRLGELIDYCLCQAPDAVVLVAMIVQDSVFSDYQVYTDAFNQQVPSVVGLRYMEGYKIMTVDMSSIGPELEVGGLHPTADGYSYMAGYWYGAIQNQVPDSWWTTTSSGANGVGSDSVGTCDRGSISFSPAIGGDTLTGGFHLSGDTPDPPSSSQSNGSTFSPGWGTSSIPAIGVERPGNPGTIFADLNGDGITDYVWANYSSEGNGAISLWLGPSWNAVNDGEPIGWGASGASYVEFADLSGDGHADYILNVGGSLVIYQNNGPLGQVWNFTLASNAANEINYIFGNDIPYHYFADFTGDGKADLMIRNPNTVLDLYINDGSDGNGGFTWTQCRAVGEAAGLLDFFVDLDGDGKADYAAMDSDGTLFGWINEYSGGCDLKWNAINGARPASLAIGVGASPTAIRLADLNGDGKADYCVVADDSGEVTMWPNIGFDHLPDRAGPGGWAANVRLSDMDGDGIDDYASVAISDGGISVWLNEGQTPGSSTSWDWTAVEDGNEIALGYTGATRSEIQLADMNADARADYLVVDSDTGMLHCYLNLGPGGGSGWMWDILGDIAIGVGGDGAGVRLADFDGDGRADYIYLTENGAAYVWRNAGSGNNVTTWEPVNNGAEAAFGLDVNRDNVVFADIDGDGKADYCYIHPDTGALTVSFNMYHNGVIGWSQTVQVADGNQGYLGQDIILARVGTSGRYDMVGVNEDNGAIQAWTNDCASIIGSATRPIAGNCGTAPLATQTTSISVPFTPRASGSVSPTITAPPICTSTYPNGGVQVFATSDLDGSCQGASRVVWQGKQLGITAESSRSAEVNSVTGARLYTSISNALASACTAPAPQETVTACATGVAVPGITYARCPDGASNGGCTSLNTGELDITIPYVRYTDNQARLAMIQAIAAVANASSVLPSNQKKVEYTAGAGESQHFFYVDTSTIPSLIEAIFSEQDLSTAGKIVLQNLEVTFELETATNSGSYDCLGLTESNDFLTYVGVTDAGADLGIGTGAAIAGPAIALSCLIADYQSEADYAANNPGPLYGAKVSAVTANLPTPVFSDYPFTYTNPNGGVTAYTASQTSSSGWYPTNAPNIALAIGTTIRVEAEATSKVNVGTLSGKALSTLSSSILTEACPIPSGTTVTACGPPTSVTSVWATRSPAAYDDDYGTDEVGDLYVSIPLVRYSTITGWNATIQAIAAAFSISSMTSNNSQTIYSNTAPYPYLDFHQVGSGHQALYVVQDETTNYVPQLELMQVKLDFALPGDDLALVCDSGGLFEGIIGLLALIPGLEWLVSLALEGPVFDAICAGLTSIGN